MSSRTESGREVLARADSDPHRGRVRSIRGGLAQRPAA